MTTFADLAQRLKEDCPTLELRSQEPMAGHTTFRIGGAVPLMALPQTEDEVTMAVQTALSMDIKPFYLGNGSNLLVADQGADCFVVKQLLGGQAVQVEGSTLYAPAGVSLPALSSVARDHSLTGLEFAYGIPGTVGGAVTMNGGAYGGEMSQVVEWVDCLDAQGNRQRIAGEDLHFSYRHSTFSDHSRCILGAGFQLEAGNAQEIQEKMNGFTQSRREKQPLNLPSGGSTFKRPPGHFAAALIDQCGLKGLTVGGAQVSAKHAGFVVNIGGATCDDVLTLVQEVAEVVLRKTGVQLELELQTLGI